MQRCQSGSVRPVAGLIFDGLSRPDPSDAAFHAGEGWDGVVFGSGDDWVAGRV
nr:hypothetical protein Iba_chr01cCG5440 [Ipomoea batatas]